MLINSNSSSNHNTNNYSIIIIIIIITIKCLSLRPRRHFFGGAATLVVGPSVVAFDDVDIPAADALKLALSRPDCRARATSVACARASPPPHTPHALSSMPTAASSRRKFRQTEGLVAFRNKYLADARKSPREGMRISTTQWLTRKRSASRMIGRRLPYHSVACARRPTGG